MKTLLIILTIALLTVSLVYIWTLIQALNIVLSVNWILGQGM